MAQATAYDPLQPSQNNYGAHVVKPTTYVQAVLPNVYVQPPPFNGETFVESWGGPLCDCTTHFQSCLFAWLCMPGATGKIAGFGGGPTLDQKEEDSGECLKHCCGQFLCPFFWPCWGVSARNLLEQRLAAADNQPPASAPCGLCGDVCIQALCGCCATAQSLRAINNFKRARFKNDTNNYGGVECIEMER